MEVISEQLLNHPLVRSGNDYSHTMNVTDVDYETLGFENARQCLYAFTLKNVGDREVKPLKIVKSNKPLKEENTNVRDLLMEQIRENSRSNLKAANERHEDVVHVEEKEQKTSYSQFVGSLQSRRAAMSDDEDVDDWE